MIDDYINEMEKDIKKIERAIKHPEITNIKLETICNLKIFGSAFKVASPYVLTATLIWAGFSFTNHSPFYIDDQKVPAIIKTIKKDDETVCFKNYNNEISDDVINHYSSWRKDINGYSRNITTYKLDNPDVPFLTTLETRENLSPIELNQKSFDEVITYTKDENDYVMKKQSSISNLGDIVISAAIISLICAAIFVRQDGKKVFNKYEAKKKKIKEMYKPINKNILTKKLEIKKNNYRRMTK